MFQHLQPDNAQNFMINWNKYITTQRQSIHSVPCIINIKWIPHHSRNSSETNLDFFAMKTLPQQKEAFSDLEIQEIALT